MISRFIVAFLFAIQSLHGQQKQCDSDVICTMIELKHNVAITDIENCPVILDEYNSRNLDTGKVLKMWKYDSNGVRSIDNIHIYEGYAYYTFVGDDYRKDEINQFGTTVRFIGKNDGKVVVKRDFLVGHDCCHTTILKGEQKVQIIKKTIPNNRIQQAPPEPSPIFCVENEI